MKTVQKLGLIILLATFAISCKKSDEVTTKDASSESAVEVATESAKSDSSSESYSDDDEPQQQQIQAGQITAGEWRDLNNWKFWNSLKQESEFSEMDKYWKYNLEKRISVNVKSDSENVIDVPVKLLNSKNEIVWESRTNNKGNAELWPLMNNENQSSVKNMKIKIGDQIFEDIEFFEDKKVNKLELLENINSNKKEKIDIAFMVDATGSMGDELEYLKEELTDVISKVKNKNENATLNMAAVFYRDKGDDYVTKKSDFSSDISETVNFINEQSADAGGDFPEAVETALSESIEDLEWSKDATSRILFLVLDAPPHYEDDIIVEIHDLIALASKKGIKIIPISSSGIDKETEFLLRYMAIATNGTYVFITNDSGIGNDHLVASVGEYQVEMLNKLMVRLINESLE